jgi:hypothetical protein
MFDVCLAHGMWVNEYADNDFAEQLTTAASELFLQWRKSFRPLGALGIEQ